MTTRPRISSAALCSRQIMNIDARVSGADVTACQTKTPTMYEPHYRSFEKDARCSNVYDV